MAELEGAGAADLDEARPAPVTAPPEAAGGDRWWEETSVSPATTQPTSSLLSSDAAAGGATAASAPISGGPYDHWWDDSDVAVSPRDGGGSRGQDDDGGQDGNPVLDLAKKGVNWVDRTLSGLATKNLPEDAERVGELGRSLLEGKKLEEAGEVVGGAGKLTKAMPWIGAGVSVLHGGIEGLEMADEIHEEGAQRAYHDEEFYKHAGALTLDGGHALLGVTAGVGELCGPYGKAVAAAADLTDIGLTGAELATDAAGTLAGQAFGKDAEFSADSVVGGALRGMLGDQSLGDQARHGVEDRLGHGTGGALAGGLAQGGVNALAAPVNLALAAGRGIQHENNAIIEASKHGTGFGGAAIHALSGLMHGGESKPAKPPVDPAM